MARLARAIAPGFPHHVTQRGNRRQQTFFGPDDYRLYLSLMAESCREYRVQIWAYSLMPNHSHLIAVPESPDGLRRAIGEAHNLYTRRVNEREGWCGHLWQGRFSSFVMDERYAIAAARYIELNPVAAGMVSDPSEYAWSSARAHLAARDDRLVSVAPLLALVGNWRELLNGPAERDLSKRLLRHEKTGRPLGDDAFVGELERRLGRLLRPLKPGPLRDGQVRRPRGALITELEAN